MIRKLFSPQFRSKRAKKEVGSLTFRDGFGCRRSVGEDGSRKKNLPFRTSVKIEIDRGCFCLWSALDVLDPRSPHSPHNVGFSKTRRVETRCQTVAFLCRNWLAANPILLLFGTAFDFVDEYELTDAHVLALSLFPLLPHLKKLPAIRLPDLQYGGTPPSVQGRVPVPEEDVSRHTTLLVHYHPPFPWWRHDHEPEFHCSTMPCHEQGPGRPERPDQLSSQLWQRCSRHWCRQVSAREKIAHLG
jgi:hypothetical protein